MTTQTEKITISLPRDLIQLADELAKEKRVSRSKVVSSCLRELADKRLHRQMEEGYKAMAEENQRFAEQALNLANEVLPEWE
jgi:metal-responsive CopG/Arc/MetJ family transcriptional regulator